MRKEKCKKFTIARRIVVIRAVDLVSSLPEPPAPAEWGTVAKRRSARIGRGCAGVRAAAMTRKGVDVMRRWILRGMQAPGVGSGVQQVGTHFH